MVIFQAKNRLEDAFLQRSTGEHQERRTTAEMGLQWVAGQPKGYRCLKGNTPKKSGRIS